MATDREIRTLAALDSRAKSLLIEELAEREIEPAETMACAWCGGSTGRTKATKRFCSTRCRVTFARKKPRCAESQICLYSYRLAKL
jgi:hypothetical protein